MWCPSMKWLESKISNQWTQGAKQWLAGRWLSEPWPQVIRECSHSFTTAETFKRVTLTIHSIYRGYTILQQ